MLLLIIASLLPYLWVILGSSQYMRMPSTGMFQCLSIVCLVFHGAFIWNCKKSGYSLLTITSFFFWIFMGLAPLMCVLTGRWLFGDISDEKSGYIVGASLLSSLFFVVFYLAHRQGYVRGAFSRYLTVTGHATDARLIMGLWAGIGLSLGVIAGLGVEGTFLRAGWDTYNATGISALFIQNVVRPMPLLMGVPMLWIALQDHWKGISFRTALASATVLIALVVNFPLSVARFYGWMVIGVFLYYMHIYPAIYRRYWIAGLIMVFAFVGSFGVDTVRSATSVGEIAEGLRSVQILNVDAFYVGNVDAFEMLVYGMQYVDYGGTTMGRQALGVVLFWVPRDFWNAKPIPTGPLLGSSFINIMDSTGNTNLSAPLVLEGYVNFGVAGVILFGIIAGFFCGSVDRAIHERRRIAGSNRQQVVWRVDAIAAPLMGLWILVLRGSLLSAFAYSSAIVFAGLIGWSLFFQIAPAVRLERRLRR